MKIVVAACVFILGVCCVSAQSDPFGISSKKHGRDSKTQTKVFLVSKVGKDKSELMEVYEAVKRIEFDRVYGKPRRFKVSQKISDTEFHGYFMKLIGNKRWMTERRRFLLRVKKPMNLADGEVIESLYVKETDETVSYTTVQGAKSTIRVVEQVIPKADIMSKKDFVFKLRAGESWTVRKLRETRCNDCVQGRRGALKGGGICPTCGGDAKVITDYEVRWK